MRRILHNQGSCCQLLGLTPFFAPATQVRLLPVHLRQFLGYDSARLLLRRLADFFTVVMRPRFLMHLFQKLSAELLLPQTPTPPHRFPLCRSWLRTPLFHHLLESPPPGGAVLDNSCLAQHPIHSQPAWSTCGRLQK